MPRMMSRRLPIVITLVVSLLAAGVARNWATIERNSGPGAAHAIGAAEGLSRMNSYALALLLGGLRGPLVMFLWPSAEQQKQDRDLEDFDTKIEWIRLLQAEFDTVHIFQIWNKAYNISVQMSSLGNKYRTILSALDYAFEVDQERPNDLNIVSAIAGVYFDKLGSSAEKTYYRERVRQESKPQTDMTRITLPAARESELVNIMADQGIPSEQLDLAENIGDVVSITVPKAQAQIIRGKFTGADISYSDRPRIQENRADPGWRRMAMDPILDSDGNILESYLKPTLARPADLDPTSDWADGSQLQYLKKYDPFPYGLSPLALGYDYFKRAQVLLAVTHQKNSQLNDDVVDTRPAIALEFWSVEEWDRGRRAELDAFGKQIPANRSDMELPTADMQLTAPIPHRVRTEEALYSYDRTVRLARDCISEFMRHLKNSKYNVTLYQSHMDEMNAQADLVAGDAAFLRAMLNGGDSKYIAEASSQYKKAITGYQLLILQHYIPDEIAAATFPADTSRANLAQKGLSAEELSTLFEKVKQALPKRLADMDNGEFIADFMRSIDRAHSRLDHLRG